MFKSKLIQLIISKTSFFVTKERFATIRCHLNMHELYLYVKSALSTVQVSKMMTREIQVREHNPWYIDLLVTVATSPDGKELVDVHGEPRCVTNKKHEYVTHEDGGQVILHLSPPSVGGGAAAGPSFRTGLSLLAAVAAAVHTMRRFRGFSLAPATYRAAVGIIFLKSSITIVLICNKDRQTLLLP